MFNLISNLWHTDKTSIEVIILYPTDGQNLNYLIISCREFGKRVLHLKQRGQSEL